MTNPRFSWDDDEPVMKIQRTGTKERGFMAWQAWVEWGLLRFEREWGTYAWTQKGAERKARRLLAKFHASQRPEPLTIDGDDG